MMGYVGRLAARSMNKADVVRPRTVSIFEPQRSVEGFISGRGVVDEAGAEAFIPGAKEERSMITPRRSFLRRGSRPPQDAFVKPAGDEYESRENSSERSLSQTSADSSLDEKSDDYSIRTLRLHSNFKLDVKPATMPEDVRDGHPSGGDPLWKPIRESSANALEERSNEPSTRTLRSHSNFKLDIKPATMPEDVRDGHLSGGDPLWKPIREDHEGNHRGVQEAVPEVVPQAKAESIFEETAQSRHAFRPFASQLPVHDERNESISPDVEPGRRKISAMMRTTSIQSSKEDPFRPQAFANSPSSPESDPVIHVTIGRVEVKASQKPPIQEKRNEVRNILSLEEYLRRPRGRG